MQPEHDVNRTRGRDDTFFKSSSRPLSFMVIGYKFDPLLLASANLTYALFAFVTVI